MRDFRSASFDRQLAIVIFLLLISVGLLSQIFPSIIILAHPLAILFSCLLIWIVASNEDSIFRKLSAICFIIMILFSTLLYWLPFSSNIQKLAVYSLIIFFFTEFTIQAKVKPRVTILWLIFVPLFTVSVAEKYFINEYWWVLVLAFPLTWSFMALYAEAIQFKSIIKNAGLYLLGFLVVIYIAINILSLSVITDSLENEYIYQLFSYSETVPIIQLMVTLVFIPFLISWAISLVIVNMRVKKLSNY